MWLALWGSLAWGANCPLDGSGAWARAADEVATAYFRVDTQAFEDAVERWRALEHCVDAVVARVDGARHHLAAALASYTEGDDAAVIRSLKALAAIRPQFELPVGLPAEHPFQQMVREAKGEHAPGGDVTLRVLRQHTYWLDGLELPEVEGLVRLPADRALVLQRFHRGSGAARTVYVASPVALDPQDWMEMGERRVTPSQRTRRIHTVGTVLSSVVLASAAGVGIGALASRAQLNKVPPEDIDRVQVQTNTLAWTSAALTGVSALGFGLTWGVRW